MAFDGFINRAVIKELSSDLIGGKISKVYQPNKDEIILNIYSNSVRTNLEICINSSNCRIHITHDKKENPANPSSFCMLLRKHLIGAKIRKIETIGLDRIVVFYLEAYNELNDLVNKKLVVELMGKHSNIILLNENDIILDSVRHISSERNILPANPYTFPTSDKININCISFDGFKNILDESQSNLVNAVSNNFYGFSKTLIYYVLSDLKIDLNNIDTTDIEHFYDYIQQLISDIDNLKVNCRNFSFNNKSDYVVISSNNVSNSNINNFLDSYYSAKEKNESFENYRNNLLKLILTVLKKYQKRLLNINSKLDECNDMQKYQLYGELITANLYKINNNINLDSIILENYYDNNKKIDIKLDKRYSPSINAKMFFKKYNKLKNTLTIVGKQKSETKRELDYIESVVYELNTATNIQEVDEIYVEIQENILKRTIVNKKSSKINNSSSSPISYSIDNYEILIGRNNKQNDLLTFKIASKEDIWFHVKDSTGSHVILRNIPNSSIPDKLLIKCASLAAFYSKAKNSSKVEVQYTKIKNIKKPKNTKPGFVTFTTYETIVVEPAINLD